MFYPAADRTSPRARLKDSLDQILAMDYDKSKVLIAVESKVFGIGMESCTVGSHEFYMNYAASRGIMCLLDSGHFHPTEMISDKISSMLLFSDKIALHVSRPVRWDSDHVVLFDDETREIAKEIVRNDRCINQNEVGEEEILSDHVYYYDVQKQELSICDTGEGQAMCTEADRGWIGFLS